MDRGGGGGLLLLPDPAYEPVGVGVAILEKALCYVAVLS